MEQSGILEQFDFSYINDMLNGIFATDSVSFQDMLQQLMQGELDFSLKLLVDTAKSALGEGFLESKNIFLAVLILGIFGALLTNVTELFKSKQVTELASYFILLLLAIILFKSFYLSMETAKEATEKIVEFMKVFIPAYSLSICFMAGTVTAYSYYQLVFIIIYLVEIILTAFMLPLCRCYAFMTIMNGTLRNKRFEGILKLLDKVIKGGIKGACFLTAGSSMIHSMLTPAIDNLNTKLVQKSVGMIPGLGDVSDSVTEVFFGSALLIKNSLGALALIVLILLCMFPLAKLFCIGGALKLAGAVVGVVGEKKQAKLIDQMGNGSFHMFQITLCTMVMFFISIALIAGVTFGGM